MRPSITSSSSVDALHREALEATRIFVAGIAADQWSAPTPCDGWDVRTLVNHVVVGNLWASELASGRTIAEVGDRLDGDHLGDPLDDGPLLAYISSAESAAAAFEAPGALDAPCAVSYGPVPGSVYAGHRFLDVLVHGYDLAAATGQPTRLDPALVDACWALVEPQLDVLSSSGMFGPGVERGVSTNTVPVDPQRRLLSALGRATNFR